MMMKSNVELDNFLDELLSLGDLPEKAKRKWNEWKEEERQLGQKVQAWAEDKKRLKEDDRDNRRNKDFERAVECLDRAGYKGVHGQFDVPGIEKKEAMDMYNLIKKGDRENWAEDDWKDATGKTKTEMQNAFIRRVNEIITRYGWNPIEDE